MRGLLLLAVVGGLVGGARVPAFAVTCHSVVSHCDDVEGCEGVVTMCSGVGYCHGEVNVCPHADCTGGIVSYCGSVPSTTAARSTSKSDCACRSASYASRPPRSPNRRFDSSRYTTAATFTTSAARRRTVTRSTTS